VSVASLLAVVALVTVQLVASPVWTDPRTLFCLVAGALVIVKHRSNIGRLLQDRENRLRETPAMIRLTKSLHVLAVALWFGSTVFFSFVVGFSLFDTFEELGEQQPPRTWFQRAAWFNHRDEAIIGPREQGSRAAGYAIAPMFVWYFALQGVCGFIAVATALAWARRGGVHRWRLSLLLTALVLVVVGWPLERRVHHLRDPRNAATERYLLEPTEENRATMRSARGEFGMWHGISVMVNLGVIALVAAATALAAHLPTEPAPQPPSVRKEETAVPEPAV
jgi:acyl phosphate:glycerol-3-phosphate acyltransferase